MTDTLFDFDAIAPEHRISRPEQLDALYGEAVPASLKKEIDHINEHYRVFVEKSPFVVVATSGPGGLDCSPRGDPAGFVRVHDSRTLLLPDRRGNNRLDALRNLLEDPRISLLFLIPGIGQTLRVNGRAAILTDPALCATFEVNGKAPVSVLMVSVERVYFQCPKALIRSRLWQSDAQVAASELPSAGQILQAITEGGFDGQAYDREYPERLKKTLY